jgi:hypothetical protein
MRSDRLPWIAAGLTGSLLLACAPKQFVVPPSDPTPPNAVWLQVDRPGRPLLNADPGSASPADHAEPGRAMQITARADDPDGGIKDVQIWMTEQRWVDNGDGTESSTGPSLPGAPSAGSPSSATAGQVASTSGRASYTLTPPATPAGRRRYVIWAAALNFYGGTTRTQELRIDVP